MMARFLVLICVLDVAFVSTVLAATYTHTKVVAAQATAAAARAAPAATGGATPMPVSDRVPELNVEALCQATTATDKEMGLTDAQSLSDCMRDETAAQQQLRTLWQTTAGPVRDTCEGEAASGGSQSYVDLLTCIQMAGPSNSPSTAPKLKGASKSRNRH